MGPFRGELWAAARRHPTSVDAIVAVLLAGAAFVSVYTVFELAREDPAFERPSMGPIAVSLLAVTLPLTLRRRFPIAVGAVVIGAFVIGRIALEPDDPYFPPWDPYIGVWACWLALYSAVVYRRRTRWTAVAVVLLTAAVAGEVVREAVVRGGGLDEYPLNQTFLLAYNGIVLALPVVLGVVIRSLRERQAELAAQAAELQREREENARRAVLEERVRIARELHDVVAHHVSVMGIQAGAARRVMERQPEQAVEALTSIEETSREAVVELQRLLGFLRRSGEDEARAPQPDLAQLPRLIEQASGGALAVEFSVEGEPRPLAPTLEVSAYRVIQEALTNALKHSDGTVATVRLDYRPGELEIEVRDDGAGAARRPPEGAGHGLMGMRERVRLHGGHLRAGPDPRGGFAVHASFPLEMP